MSIINIESLAEKYEIIETINKGSFGTVYLAKNHDSEKVAIKRTEKSGVSGESALMEINALLKCKALDNVISCLEVLDDSVYFYIVLEYCPAGDLYETLKNNKGPSSHGEILSLVLQLVDTVLELHECGVYHRDIKPENMMIDTDGNIKLADFGLATFHKWTNEKDVGSNRYMAPESFISKSDDEEMIDSSKLDYWSVGIVFLNLIFGRHPFTEASQKCPLWMDYLNDRQSLYDIFPTMATATFNALQLLLNPDPSKRDLVAFKTAIQSISDWTNVEDDIFVCQDVSAPMPEPSHSGSYDSGIGASLASNKAVFKKSTPLYDTVLSSSLPGAKFPKMKHIDFVKSWSDCMDESDDDDFYDDDDSMTAAWLPDSSHWEE